MRRGTLLVCDQNRIVEMDAATAATIGMIVGLAGHEVCQMPDGSRASAEQGMAMLQAVQVTGSMTVGDYWLIGPRGRVYVHSNRLVAHTVGGRVFVSCSIKYQSFALDSLTPGDSRGIFGSVTQRSRMSTEPNETIVALFPRWSRYMKSMCDFGAQHISKSQADVAAIAEQTGWIYPHEMNARGLSDWAMTYIESLSARGLSGRKRAKNMASSARSFAAWCKQERIIAEHDLGDAKLPTVRKSHRGKGARAFALDEVKRLILASEEMEAKSMRTGRYGPNRSVLYCFLAHTGLRYLESMRLTWNDADLDTAILHVRLDKAGRGDSIPMSAECVQALRDLRAFRATDTASGHIFRKVSHHTLVADMERAGIPGRAEGKAGEWHRFRKFMVTERLRSGQDPKKVQRLARHATLELTTGIYNDLEMDELRGTAESFGRLNGFLEKNSCPGSTEPIYSPSHTATEPVVPSHAPNIQTPPEREAPPLCDYSGKLDRPAPVESGCPGRSAEGHSHPGSTAAQWSRGESTPRLSHTHSRTGQEHGHANVFGMSRGETAFWVFAEPAKEWEMPRVQISMRAATGDAETGTIGASPDRTTSQVSASRQTANKGTPTKGHGNQRPEIHASQSRVADQEPREDVGAQGREPGDKERNTGSSAMPSMWQAQCGCASRVVRGVSLAGCDLAVPKTSHRTAPTKETEVAPAPVAQREHLLSGESTGHPDGEGARSIRAGGIDSDLGRKECDNTVTVAFVVGGDICGAASSESGWEITSPKRQVSGGNGPLCVPQRAKTLPA